MSTLETHDINEIIHIKLETTRAICEHITDSHLTQLSNAAKAEFADIIELIAILMLEHAGEFPEEWTHEKLSDIYHYKLPTLLSPSERQNIKNILITYVEFVGQALELPNYKDIRKNLAS
ncbi:MAG: hypothetical protein FWG67_06570 [Defluviitaleaceae bacterium]|nr:hypothetical protein [Defluviitaleaceae bacterium]